MKKIIVLVIGVLISSCSNDNLIDENSEMLGNLNKVELSHKIIAKIFAYIKLKRYL